MGLGGFLKSLFASKPIEIDYSELSDDRLRALWSDRSQLTDEALGLLEAEVARRELRLPDDGKGRRPLSREELRERAELALDLREQQRRAQPLEPMAENPIVMVSVCGVALRTQGRRAVLCLLPVRQSDTRWTLDLERDLDLEIEALVACNQSQSGYLPTAWVAARLGVPESHIYALDPALPVDRPLPTLGAKSIVARKMPKQLDAGLLRLKPFARRTDTLLATWADPNDGVPERALIGPALHAEDIAWCLANIVIGGLAETKSKSDLVLELIPRVRQVLLLPEVEGVSSWATALGLIGLNVVSLGAKPADRSA